MKIYTIRNMILQSCSYLLYEDKKDDCYLIDCGDADPIFQFLKEKNKILKAVFLTHSHYDHIYGLNTILGTYPDVVVVCSKLTIEGLQNADINLSYMYDSGDYVVKNAIIIDVKEYKQEVLCNKIYAFPTPGHDLDCLTYIIGDNIFTGDAYNPDFEVFTRWRRSSEKDASISIQKILNMVEEKHLKIFAGHYK